MITADIKTATPKLSATIGGGATGKGNVTSVNKKIGDVVLTASDIHFLDGENFQEKYNSGELKGQKGDKGNTGNSPKASILQDADGATITVIDDNGTTTAKLNNGTDGVSPQASVVQGDGEAVITITDSKGTTTAILKDGKTYDDTQVKADIKTNADIIKNLNYSNAGSHNSIYRGKYLGLAVTPEQYKAIAEGTFDDLYIGDYWIIDNVNYRVAAFNYYYNTGNPLCTTNHAVIVPDKPFYYKQMNKTASEKYEPGTANTTEGGYIGSDLYKTGLDKAKETIKKAFEGHVLKHRIYLINAVSNGHASAGIWTDSEVELLSEQMAFGSPIYRPCGDGINTPNNRSIEKAQLPLFNFRFDLIRSTWLRDIISEQEFSFISDQGRLGASFTSYSNGVVPYFCIC